ncbi:MAG: metal-dependent hydrolase [Halobacteriota archaeon]
MWPWEHIAVGYLLYSLGARGLGRPPPSDGAVVALAVASLLPDLVDKPLSWGLGWFPSGYAIGHSAFVAIPVGLAVLLFGSRLDRPWVSVAFVVGYWTHLLGDVLNPLRYGNPILVGRVLWPVSAAEPYEIDRGLGRGLAYLEDFVAELVTMPITDVVLLYLLLPAATIALWIFDGAPGVTLLSRAVGTVRSRLR